MGLSAVESFVYVVLIHDCMYVGQGVRSVFLLEFTFSLGWGGGCYSIQWGVVYTK